MRSLTQGFKFCRMPYRLLFNFLISYHGINKTDTA